MLYFITGVGSGLGRSLALLLAQRRQALVLSDLHPGRLEETARACREAGAEVQAFVWDVTQSGLLAGQVATLPEAWQVPDVVVANKRGTFVMLHEKKTVTSDEWRQAQPKRQPSAGTTPAPRGL